MKNARRILLGICFVGFGLKANAQSTYKLEVSVKEENKIAVELRNFSDNYSIHISNSKGENIYEANDLKIANLKFAIELKDQEQGLYRLSVKDEEKMQSVPFILKSDAISLNSKENKMTYFPQFEKDGNSILVKLISNNLNEIELGIENKEGRRLHYEQIGGQIGMIGKRFKFEPGAYVLTLNSNDYHIEKILDIK